MKRWVEIKNEDQTRRGKAERRDGARITEELGA